MNCIWIIALLFCTGNQRRGTSECGCMSESRDCLRDPREERQENRRSSFEKRKEDTCPCKREFDYYQAEMQEAEDKLV